MVLGDKVVWYFHQAGKFFWHLSGPVRIWDIFNAVTGLKDTLKKKKINQCVTLPFRWIFSGFANVCLMCTSTVDAL